MCRLSLERYDISNLARELGISSKLLYQWRREFKTKGLDSFPGKGNTVQGKEVKELQQLKRSNARLEKENEILKKALSIISQSEL